MFSQQELTKIALFKQESSVPRLSEIRILEDNSQLENKQAAKVQRLVNFLAGGVVYLLIIKTG
jgi:hypothetical protein